MRPTWPRCGDEAAPADLPRDGFLTGLGRGLQRGRRARAERSRLFILHVLLPASPFLAGDVNLPPSYLELQARARRQAERRLEALLARARREGVRAKARLTGGAPAQDILRWARRKRADLIVIGTHGRSALGRFFMGSVAERVVRLSPIPVLTVRGR